MAANPDTPRDLHPCACRYRGEVACVWRPWLAGRPQSGVPVRLCVLAVSPTGGRGAGPRPVTLGLLPVTRRPVTAGLLPVTRRPVTLGLLPVTRAP